MPNFGASYHLIKMRQDLLQTTTAEVTQYATQDETPIQATTPLMSTNYKPKLSMYLCGIEPSLGISI